MKIIVQLSLLSVGLSSIVKRQADDDTSAITTEEPIVSTFFALPDEEEISTNETQTALVCEDEYPNCATTWRNRCNVESIKWNCRKSCNACEDVAPTEEETAIVCEDAPGTLCSSAAVSAETCKLFENIRDNCPKSCGTCGKGLSGGKVEETAIDLVKDTMIANLCVDKLPDNTCATFTDQCDSKAVYALCMKTCNKCETLTKIIENNSILNPDAAAGESPVTDETVTTESVETAETEVVEEEESSDEETETEASEVSTEATTKSTTASTSAAPVVVTSDSSSSDTSSSGSSAFSATIFVVGLAYFVF